MAHILIIDDDPIVRTLIRCNLEHMDHIIEEACDGEEAIFAIEHDSYDLLILDIVMPKKGGIETLMEIREKGYSTNFIAISGNVSENSRAINTLMEQYGVHHFLSKPLDLENLITTVQEIC